MRQSPNKIHGKRLLYPGTTREGSRLRSNVTKS